jgi:MFS family permease
MANYSQNLLSDAKPGHGARIWLTALLITMPSFLYGYHVSSLNQTTGKADEGASGTLLNDIPLTLSQKEYVTSAIVFGAWAGSFVVSVFTPRFGLAKTLLANNCIFIAGASKFVYYFLSLWLRAQIEVDCKTVKYHCHIVSKRSFYCVQSPHLPKQRTSHNSHIASHNVPRTVHIFSSAILMTLAPHNTSIHTHFTSQSS